MPHASSVDLTGKVAVVTGSGRGLGLACARALAEAGAAVVVNDLGPAAAERAAAIRMREQGEGGSLVLVGSPAGQRGDFGQTNYAAAKAGIATLART